MSWSRPCGRSSDEKRCVLTAFLSLPHPTQCAATHPVFHAEARVNGVENSSNTARTTARSALWPAGLDKVSALLVLIGLAALYVPTYVDLAQRVWPIDEQGHGPVILVVSLWLLWARRHDMASVKSQPARVTAAGTLVAGVLLYVLGRTQNIQVLEVASQLLVLIGLVLLFRGPGALRVVWFPLFLMVFAVPLPGSVVASLTVPWKAAVSAVTAELLYNVGYPVAHAGAFLSIGPYQLLVADTCAGLNSLLALEALGLVYLKLMKSTSALRNLSLALLIIPISFAANVVRVATLVLVTYHFGGEAGQDFMHRFASLVFYLAGLSLMLGADALLRNIFRPRELAA